MKKKWCGKCAKRTRENTVQNEGLWELYHDIAIFVQYLGGLAVRGGKKKVRVTIIQFVEVDV